MTSRREVAAVREAGQASAVGAIQAGVRGAAGRAGLQPRRVEACEEAVAAGAVLRGGARGFVKRRGVAGERACSILGILSIYGNN